MKVILAEGLHQHLPSIKVHVLVARAIDLDVLRFFQVIPPVLDPDHVESLIMRWQAFHRQWLGNGREQSALENLLRCVMNECFSPSLPLSDMHRYASLLAMAPISAYALQTLHGGLSLELAQSDDVRPLAELAPVWCDGRQQQACRILGGDLVEGYGLQDGTCDIVFVGEQPDADFPSPERGMRYLYATLFPLCTSLQSGVLDVENPRLWLE
ncbi:hypothetical protein [Paludibacterium purpuratum]|uniref:Uncharacterized protein n=1 Tax=Paludibacterium purpuratum TaxID=1144873 RepID=A0A4R7B5X7_9NEIS|nr:hypothetical protein [Paludibacterium purpuratum]TDR78444.1 hypothetical protein DFP86_108163 [Paludibacterium purpuratum]